MKKIISFHAAKGSTVRIMLKKNLLILIMIFLGLSVFANPKMASKQQIGMFINSKTCVVLESGSLSYNVLIKDAVQKYWKSTEFEFIDQYEFEKRRYDSKYSFLVLMRNVFDKDPSGVGYNYISLVLGDKAKNITNMPELCCIPISYSDDNNLEYGYAIPAIIKFMQIHVKNLEKKRFLILLKGLKYYNGSDCFKYQALLLNEKMMAPNANSDAKIKSAYQHFFMLLNTSQVEAEIPNKPTNTLFLFHVGPTIKTGSGKCFEMIFDVEGNLYYYNYRNVTNDNPDGFNLNDFKHIR
ncbi:MAG: hypothetical protein EHM93_11725 [Bacteroidales bacterium]|nr:MAG: hypothetical protein EHM93_11725 [Bacteroidales bacterium]